MQHLQVLCKDLTVDLLPIHNDSNKKKVAIYIRMYIYSNHFKFLKNY